MNLSNCSVLYLHTYFTFVEILSGIVYKYTCIEVRSKILNANILRTLIGSDDINFV